jgi:energy-coupling factor transporter ATP-binding protein EcfA2
MTPGKNNFTVRIEHLTYTYPNGTQALHDIHLEIRHGEYLAIMGANGAGKTTTCLFLNGVIPHISGGKVRGQVEVMGVDTFENHVYEIAQKVGMVLQDPEAQLFSSNVRSEVAFAAENLGIPYDQMVEQVDWAIRTVRLDGMEDRTPAQLSGGQKQRLSIASGLVVRPGLLVLDEPTSQLDPLGTDEVFSVLKDLNQELGLTIVLATHKAEQVAKFADRVVVLEEGQVVAQGTPPEVFSQVELLDRIFVPIPQVTRIDSGLSGGIGEKFYSVTLDESLVKCTELLSKNKWGKSLPADFIFQGVASNQGVEIPNIQVQDVSFIYPNTEEMALNGINLEIFPREFVGVIGQNGAGKSTLMKSILGLLTPSRGQILLDGEDVAQSTPATIARKIGLVLQNPDTQLFALSAWEEVAFGPRNCGLSEEEVEQRVESALIAVGLWEKRDLYPFNFSFGDRRKLSVAAVAAMEPDILIFDEPTTGQDYKGRYELARIAEDLNKNGTTVIMITHDMGLIAEFTRRLVVMGNGRILLDGPTRNVFQETETLAQTFITPPQVTQLALSLKEYGVPSGILTTEEFCQVLAPHTRQAEGGT